MASSVYHTSRQQLIDFFLAGYQTHNDEASNGQFNMVSASLSNFLPAIDYSSHRQIYHDILLNKKLSILEQGSFETLSITNFENLDAKMLRLMKSKPVIFCVFHSGSYRAINLLLLKHKIPFGLVVAGPVYKQEANAFAKVVQQLSGNDQAGFTIINAELPGSAIQMLKQIKSGRSLVVYIDGNVGTGNPTALNANSCLINFLAGQVYARKGAGFLAHIADTPVIVTTSYRPSWAQIKVKLFDPIFADKSITRDNFANKLTQTMYSLAAATVKAYPGQWEPWLYLHKTAKPVSVNHQKNYRSNTLAKHEKIRLNSHLYGLISLHGIPFLLQKSDYTFHELRPAEVEILSACNGRFVDKKAFDDLLVRQLCDKNILTG